MMFDCLGQLVLVRLRQCRKSTISRYKRQLTTKLPVSGLSSPYRYAVHIHFQVVRSVPSMGKPTQKHTVQDWIWI